MVVRVIVEKDAQAEIFFLIHDEGLCKMLMRKTVGCLLPFISSFPLPPSLKPRNHAAGEVDLISSSSRRMLTGLDQG